MWSYYASNHTGVAIEVDVPEPLSPYVLKVEYSDDLPKINPLALVDMSVGMKENLFETLFLRKSKCWEHEQEYRVLRFSATNPLNVPSEAAPLPAGCRISRLILGFAMPPDIKMGIVRRFASKVPNIELAAAVPSSESAYALTIVNTSEIET